MQKLPIAERRQVFNGKRRDPISSGQILRRLEKIILELGRFPTEQDFRGIRSSQLASGPTICERFGSRAGLKISFLEAVNCSTIEQFIASRNKQK